MKRCKRKVFGRRRIEISGGVYVISMLKDQITVRELWSRRIHQCSLHDLVDAMIGQRTFRLGEGK